VRSGHTMYLQCAQCLHVWSVDAAKAV
jgi:hypothetical protein